MLRLIVKSVVSILSIALTLSCSHKFDNPLEGIQSSVPSRVVATIPVGRGPFGIAILPNGEYVYVVNTQDDNISVIRASDNIIVATIPTGYSPFDITVLPNGSYVYVTSNNGYFILVIRTSDNTVTDTISLGSANRSIDGIAAHPNSNYIYAAVFDSVSVIRTSDNTVVSSIPLPTGSLSGPIAILPNGNYAYVSTYKNGGGVSVIRTSDNTVVANIPIGGDIRSIASAPNGNYVYVGGDSKISVISTGDNKVANTIPFGVRGIAVLPDGKYLYAAVDRDVRVIQTSDNAEVARISEVGSQPEGITTHPTGKFVYVSNYGENKVTVIGF